ncbi:MAG: hypothetical protein ACK55I_34010, partial [bacterium]
MREDPQDERVRDHGHDASGHARAGVSCQQHPGAAQGALSPAHGQGVGHAHGKGVGPGRAGRAHRLRIAEHVAGGGHAAAQRP